jgi:hypothetical protein
MCHTLLKSRDLASYCTPQCCVPTPAFGRFKTLHVLLYRREHRRSCSDVNTVLLCTRSTVPVSFFRSLTAKVFTDSTERVCTIIGIVPTGIIQVPVLLR